MDKEISNLQLNCFLGGFLFGFGLSDNPLKQFRGKFNKINDDINISNDWVIVGNHIRKSYEREIEKESKR